MKVVGLGGVPCSGKSTLAKRFIERNLKQGTPFQWNLIRGTHKQDLIVVGVYDDKHIFGGTDRLSMAAAPDFIRWLRLMKNKLPHARIFFEGDRLFTATILEAIRANGIELRAIVLDVDNKERERRKKLRGDAQTEKFVQGRRTKYENIIKHGLANRFFHETTADTDFLLKEIETFFGC